MKHAYDLPGRTSRRGSGFFVLFILLFQVALVGWGLVVVSRAQADPNKGMALGETAVPTINNHGPPQIRVSPDSFHSTQPVNSQLTQTLTIYNYGAAPLSYTLSRSFASPRPTERPSPAESFLAWAPLEGLIGQPARTLFVAATAVSPTVMFPVLADPLGDGGPADLVDVLAGQTETAVIMQLQFASGVVSQQVWGLIFLDTDQNPMTGEEPIEWFGRPGQDVGFEYFISLFDAPAFLHVHRSDGFYLGSIIPVYEADSLLFTIPLSLLGDDDGNMNVAMVLGDFVGPTEWAPDAGRGVVGSGLLPEWLKLFPASGEIAGGGSAASSVVYNSNGLQPGLYPARIRVYSNGPADPLLTLPVSLTVEPSASMGWVSGYVRDGRFATPIEALITAQGQPYTITAGVDGSYKLWLEAGRQTLRLTAAGYVTQETAVVISTQQGTPLNVALVEDVPIFDWLPDQITMTLPTGSIAVQTMTIRNRGPAEMAFVIQERDAADNPDGATNLLTWLLYTNYPWEYANSLNALAQYAIFNLTETATEDPAVLATLLATTDVFLIPEQEHAPGGYLFTLGQSWADVLGEFLRDGGVIVLLDHCNQTFQLLQGAGLLALRLDSCGSHHMLETVDAAHPLLWNVPPIFYARNGVAFYLNEDEGTIVKLPGTNNAVIVTQEVGNGRLAVIGFDYYRYNDDMARILANAVQWHSSDVPWLMTLPLTGSLPAGAALDITLLLNAAGLPPDAYHASLVVNTSDPHRPFQVVAVRLEVEETAVVPVHIHYLPLVTK